MADVEIAQAPDLGIGPAPESPDDTPEEQRPPMFAPESAESVPSDGVPGAQKEGPAESKESGSEDGKQKPKEPEPFDWKKVDFRRTKPEDVPEEHRPEYEAMLKQFKAVQGDSTRRLEDVTRRERAVDAKLQRVESLIDRLEKTPAATTQAPAKAAAEAAEQVQEEVDDLLANPELDDETRDAVKLMDTRAQKAVAKVQSALDNLMEKLKVVDQIAPTIQQMTNKQKADVEQARNALIMEAVDVYGSDIDTYSTEIRDAMGWDSNSNPIPGRVPWQNRATGKSHTPKTLYELFSGKTAQAALSARQEDEEIKGEAKKKAAGVPASASPKPKDGKLSESEGRSAVKALGFGAN